jgi:hypothetical protein
MDIEAGPHGGPAGFGGNCLGKRRGFRFKRLGGLQEQCTALARANG